MDEGGSTIIPNIASATISGDLLTEKTIYKGQSYTAVIDWEADWKSNTGYHFKLSSEPQLTYSLQIGNSNIRNT